MLNKISNRNIYIIYLLLTITIASSAHTILNIQTAKTFDKYYFYILVASVCLYAIISKQNKLNILIKDIMMIGVSVSIISSVVYYLYDKVDKYFSFEMEGYTWVGIYGFTRIIIYLVITWAIGILLWYIKLCIIKLISN